jgi:hypothetical protein
MIKKILIVALIVLLIGGFFALHTYHVPIQLKQYYEHNVAWDYGEFLRTYIQYTNPDVIKIADTLKCQNEEQSIINAYNWLEKNYHYISDSDVSWSNGVVTIHNHSDYWQSPTLSLTIIKQTGGFYGDCEDGSILLTTLLRAMGYDDVWLTIGTVDLSSGIYGHAWVEWKEYLLETTRGAPLNAFIRRPAFYHPSVQTNGDQVRIYTAVQPNAPILTPEARQELLQKLNKH